jgi:hypothetical protein
MNAAAKGSSPSTVIVSPAMISDPKLESADSNASAKASPPIVGLIAEVVVIGLDKGGASLTCR